MRVEPCVTWISGLRDPRAYYESNDTRFGVRRSVVFTVVAGGGGGGGKRATTQVLQCSFLLSRPISSCEIMRLFSH